MVAQSFGFTFAQTVTFAISQQRFDRSEWNLACWCILAHWTLPAVKIL